MSEILPDAKVKADFEKRKKSVLHIFDIIRSLETEALAYKMGAFGFIQTKPENITHDEEWRLLQVAVELAKLGPAQRVIAEKYDAFLEQFQQQADEAGLEKAISEWLQGWKPTDSVD